MSAAESIGWRRTSPLAAAFFIGTIVRKLVQNAIQALAPIAALAFASEGSAAVNALLGIALMLAGVIGVAILRYLFFRYRIEESSILIRDGILRKKQLDIKFDRIQAINTEQNLLYRPFGLVNVRLDTAGSSTQEGYLPAISRKLAEDLEARLENHARAKPEVDEVDEEALELVEGERRTLLSYDARDLIVIGLTSNRALVLLAVIAPFLDQLFQAFGERAALDAAPDSAQRIVTGDIPNVLGTVVLVALLIAIGLILASLIGAVLRYFRFHLVADAQRFRSVGGLLTRHEHSVRFTKIQSLHLYQNVMQRLFRVYRLSMRQAASGKESSRKSFALPMLRPTRLSAVTETALGDEYSDVDLDPGTTDYAPVHRHYLRSHLLIRGVLPSLAFAVIAAPALQWLALLALLWVPLMWINFRLRYSKLGVRLRREGLSVRSGFLGWRVAACLYRKVQRVTIRQSPFQRRRGLATVKLYLASGVIRVPFVNLEDAARLRDYILFCVETDSRAWH